MALCHTVVVDEEKGETVYSSPSPDEVALVKASADNGIRLTGVSAERYEINVLGEDQSYQILEKIEFNSDRKRQSVILKYPNGEIWLLVKGADSIMDPLIGWESVNERTIVFRHLSKFSIDGL